MTRAAVSRTPRSKGHKLPPGGRRRGKSPALPSAVPLTSLPGAVVTTDQAGAITFVSAEAARLAGWTAKAARGRLIGELLKHFPPRRGQRAISFQQWLRSRKAWNTLWRCHLTPRRGRKVPVQLRVQPLAGAAGRIGGAVLYLLRRRPAAAQAGRVPNVSAMFRRGQPFRAAFEDTAIGMALVDPAGQFLRVNQALCAIVGYTSAELLSLTFQSLTHPEDLGGSLQVRDQLLAGAPDQHWEKRYIHKDGHIVWVRLSAAPLRDKRGKVRYFVSGFQDITALKNVAESLRDSEALFRSTFDASAVGIMLINPEGYVLRANQALARFVGYAAEELIGQHISLINFPEGYAQGVARRQQMVAGDTAVGYPIDKRYRHKSGAEIWGRLSAALVRDAFNRPNYFIGFIQDVTERHRAEVALRESEALFRSAFDASAIGMALVSLEGRYLRVNRMLCEFVGYPAEILLNSDITLINEPEEYAKIVDQRRQMLDGEGKQFRSYEQRFRHQSGRILWGQKTVALIRDAAGQPSYFVVLIQETTERHQAEAALRESEQRLRLMFDGMPILMDAFDEQGLIVAWNKECERVTGYSAEEMVGNPKAMEILYPDTVYRDAMLAESIKLQDLPHRGQMLDLRCKDGSIKTIAWSNVGPEVKIPGWRAWAVGIDITERRRLEIALQQASEHEQRRLGQEMHDGLGQELAALALLAHVLASKPELAENPIRRELDRLAQIAGHAVRSGRAIAHGLAPLEDSEDGLIQALRGLTERHVSDAGGAEVTFRDTGSAELAIPASARSHLYRMAQEALNNAIRHAEARSVRIHFAVDAKNVRLTVTDDGRGMTARSQRAAGMGLKTLRDRATAIDGTLLVEAAEGGGTRVTIECPNIAAAKEPAQQRAAGAA